MENIAGSLIMAFRDTRRRADSLATSALASTSPSACGRRRHCARAQRMGLAASAVELAMWMWDIPRDEIWNTDKGHALFGFAKSDKINFDLFLNSLHPEDRERLRHAVASAVNGDGEYEGEYRIALPEGQVRWIAGRGRV